MVKVHEIVKEYVDNIIEVPFREEIIKEVPVEIEKIIQVHSEKVVQKEVQIIKDKIVEVPKVIELINTQNFIQTQVEVVDRFEQTQVPVFTNVERIVEVPQVM